MNASLLNRFVTASVLLVGSQDLASAATFHLLGGVQDSYVLPTEPVNPSAGLKTYFNIKSIKPYDYVSADLFFADTITPCPMCITAAELTIGVKPFGLPFQGALNDTIYLGFIGNAGTPIGPFWNIYIANFGQPSLLSFDWGSTGYPNGAVLNLDLAALPPNPNGSSKDLLTNLQQLKFLDVVVQDDTTVDFVDLLIRTSLDGDINGDGCVDSKDLALFAANFGNPVPPGLGDPNGDGIYNAVDLALVQADFGKCCMVPEPAGLTLLLLGTVSWGLRTRRR